MCCVVEGGALGGVCGVEGEAGEVERGFLCDFEERRYWLVGWLKGKGWF